MSYQDVDDFLGGSGAPAISWKDAPTGAVVSGKVVSSAVANQTDPKTGKVKTWDDGGPMKQLVITLHNPAWEGETDNQGNVNRDGTKRLFCKGSKKPESKSMLAAVIEALRKTEAKLEPGGELTVKYLGEGEQSNKAFNPPKLFQAKYDKPAFNPAEEEW